MIEITIEGASFTADTQFTLERNLLEEREFGTITLKNNRQSRFETYDRVDIDIEGNIEQYLVQSDSVTTLRNNVFQHEITLIENIARFDVFYPADRSFTRVPSQTLGDILNVYKRELNAFHGISIDYDSQATWTQVLMPEKEFIGVNFSIILTDLFRRINAHPKVERIDNVWTITPQYYSLRNNPISDVGESVLARMQSKDYATKIKAQVKNGIYERYEEVWFPSSDGSVLPKSSSPQVISSNLRYELDSPIIQITKAVVPNIQVQLIETPSEEEYVYDLYESPNTNNAYQYIDDTYDTENDDVTITNVDVDITDYVITKQDWETLDTIQDIKSGQIFKSDNSRNHIYYQIGSRYIENLYASNTHNVALFFEGNTEYLINAINRVLYKTYVETGLYNGAVVTFGTRTKDVPLRVEYLRQRDLDIVHNRQFNGAMNDSTFLHTQRDSYTEIARYKNNLKGMSNRLGNEAFDKSKTFQLSETPYQVGDFDAEGNVIVRVKNTFTNGYILCEYTLTKNFANIDGGQISRQPSPFSISRKRATTNLVVNDFCEISETDKTNTSRLNADARKSITSILTDNRSDAKPIHFGLFQPRLNVGREEETNGIIMPVFSGAGGNTMSFHVNFTDIQKAGDKFTTNFASPIAYTYILSDGLGVPGTVDNFTLFFTEQVDVNDTGSYPLNENYSDFESKALTDPNVFEPIDLDINASFAETYHVHFVTDDNQIVIGNAMAKYNPLHYRQLNDLDALKMVIGEKPFTIYDDNVRASDTVTSAITWTTDVVANSITFNSSVNADYWALCVGDEIILASNKNITQGQSRTLYLNFVEEVGRTLSNTLKPPLITDQTINDTNISVDLRNINDEAVDFTIELRFGRSGTGPIISQQTTASVPANSEVTYTFTGLDYLQDYVLKAQAIALSGSSKVDSVETRYLLETATKQVQPPSVSLIGRTATTAKFEFSNPNNFEVDIRAYVNDELLTVFTERTFNLTLAANAQTVQADIDALEEDGYYEIAFDSIWNNEFPFVASEKTDEFVLTSAQPDIPIVELVDDSDTTTSQFKMRYALASTAPYSVRAYVSVNNGPFNLLGTINAGQNITQIYTNQNIPNLNQLGPASTVPIAVYYEYTIIGVPSEIQDRVSGHTRPERPTFQVIDIAPYAATIRVFNPDTNNADFARLLIPSLSISTNVPAGNFYELVLTGLNDAQTFNYASTIRFANLDSATQTITFSTPSGQLFNPVLSVSTSTEDSITPLITNNSGRTVIATARFSQSSNLFTVGTVFGNSAIEGATFSEAQLEANRGLTYYAQFTDPDYPSVQTSVVNATLYTSPLKPVISNFQFVTAGPDVVQVSFDLTNDNDQFGPQIDATLDVLNATNNQSVTGGTVIDVTPNSTNNYSFNLSSGDIAVGDSVEIRVTFDNPTSESFENFIGLT